MPLMAGEVASLVLARHPFDASIAPDQYWRPEASPDVTQNP